jgi:hypothetical protein
MASSSSSRSRWQARRSRANAVLGLDAPSLDSCANGACVDAAGNDGAVDARGDAIADASSEKPVGVGVRCGGGSFSESACAGQTPVCCQTNDDAGAAYACVANADACAGYPISCATNNDCAGTSVCCHYSSHIKCVGQTTCANDSLVCEPDGAADQCPAGWSCKVAAVNDGVTSPYFTCGP